MPDFFDTILMAFFAGYEYLQKNAGQKLEIRQF